ncbi:MAG: hypothetical protein G3I11_01335 [Ferrovum sp.]|nr:hypothetical protein [Ferrovum sp.]
MSRLSESAIEDFAIKLFERLGYSYVYAPDIAPDGEQPERSHYDTGEYPINHRVSIKAPYWRGFEFQHHHQHTAKLILAIGILL